MNQKRVLLVDDDGAFRERLAVALRHRGLGVTTATDAAEAVSLALPRSFDAAVIDLRMPGRDGLTLVGELHALLPDARLLVLTGYGSIATAVEAVHRGAADYLTKPADADQVYAALMGGSPLLAPVAPVIPSLDRVEWEHIQRVLSECCGNISQAARILGVDRSSLQRKLIKYPPNR